MLKALSYDINYLMADILRQYKLLALFTLCFAVCFHYVVYAQNFDAKQIKSAYMINFFKHITWPDEASKDTYQLAIYQEPSYVDFLSKALKNKKIKNKIIVVTHADNLTQLKQADSVYIPQQFNEELHDIANALRGTNTLLISDNSLDKHDVMLNLIQQGDSAVISFEVNKSNIIYENLNMSADILLLGGSELDIATLYRETEMAMQKTRAKSVELTQNLMKHQKTLLIQKQSLLTQQQKLKVSAVQLNRSKNALKKSNEELVRGAQAALKQKAELAKLKLDIEKKQLQSTKTETELIKQQSILAEKSIINEKILATVAQNKKVLKQQEVEIALHKYQLKEQDADLINKKKIISNQQTYLFLTTILTTLAIMVVLLIVFFFIKNKKITKKLTKTLANLNDTQEQLVQSEKMASLGRLVAGVAHEINTPLSIAITANSLVLDDMLEIKDKITNTSLSKKRMDEHITLSEKSLLMSEGALERVKHLLTNFKMVAADQIISEQRTINLAKYIDDVMSTLSIELKKNNVSYQLIGVDDLELSTFPGVFSQVLSNLVMNSMVHGFDKKQGGNITIDITSSTSQCVELHYKDDGKGMDAHTLANIFEPFFTTKRGKGSTGLGMNIVYNLVNQQLKGSILVTTEEGAGTFVTIILPRSV